MNYLYLTVPDVCGYKVKHYYSNKISEENPRNWIPHLHDTLELYVLIEGDVSFSVESSLYKLSAGDAIISKPNELHNCILNTRSVHRHLCFWFDTSAGFVFDEFIKHDFGVGNHVKPDSEAKERLLQIYNSLVKANENGDRHAEFYLTLEMLGIFRKFIGSDSDSTGLPGIMQDIMSDINANLKSIKNLDYFTAKYFLSQSTLYRMFKTYLNTTPKLYIETKKLAYSRKLLKEGSSVGEAALESGFSDVSNFIRLFKKRFSVTPKEYKDS